MKTLISLLLLLVALPAYANWQIVPVIKPGTSESVGFIYHIYATGNLNTGSENKKEIAGLRFVCSSTTNESPLLILYWIDMQGSGTKEITLQDGVKTETYKWTQENNIMWRRLQDSKKLLQTVKSSSVIRLSWTDKDKSYSVSFDMTDFNKQYAQFKTKCKIAD